MTRRRLAWALAAYGVLGLVLLVMAGGLGADVAGRAERLMGGADRTLTAAMGTAEAAAEAFRGTDASLERGAASAAEAATLAHEASGTLADLADAMQVSILGTQPLAGLSDDFSRSAEQADALGTELEGIGTALGESRSDLVAVADRLGQLANELETLQGTEGADTAAAPFRLLLVLILAWLAIPSIAALAAAAWLLQARSAPASV